MPYNSSSGASVDFANERPAHAVSPPAVVRHLLFRLAAAENPRFEDDEELRKARWDAICRCMTRHVNVIQHAFGDPEDAKIVPPEMANAAQRCFSVQRSAMIEIVGAHKFGYRLRVRMDVYTELFSVTYIVDRIGARTPADTKLHEQLLNLSNPAYAADWLFDGFWSSPDYPAAAETMAWSRTANRDSSEDVCIRTLGQPVADLRTLLLCPQLHWQLNAPALGGLDMSPTEKVALIAPLQDFVKRNEPLIRHIAGSDAGLAGTGESILCGMIDGHALYAAKLGQWSAFGEVAIIRNLLVYGGRSDEQAGRLLRRCHVAGELRHAALLDWDLGSKAPDLRSASVKMRGLGVRLNRVTIKPTVEEIEKLLGVYADITGTGQGGLFYRIEHSRYYASEYLNQLKHFRMTRLGEWQTYDDFVNRYIRQLFRRIDHLGNRYEALGRRLNRLMYFEQVRALLRFQDRVGASIDGIHQANQALNVTSDIQIKLLEKTRLGLKDINEATEKLNEASKEQIGLLRYAEALAVLFSVYYFGDLLRDALQENSDFVSSYLNFDYDADKWMISAALFAIASCCVVFLLFQYGKRKGLNWRKRRASRRL